MAGEMANAIFDQ
ncbi:hypothetical protein CGLO_06737 [Colletotrichum gloeosporioides Cg-14]|uniref:Uncharacterized protein n=1 Tax=Colletotrichum gloeosporioides (strain Cg-14) TaxID=1237896 RepID=T0LP80_COLGC|nr:hypothetical protein CGLO_06737 [Colletotrichum gloeosporioides Cg-14]